MAPTRTTSLSASMQADYQVLMTPLASAVPTSQRQGCWAWPANAHRASFPQTDVGDLDAGLACPLQPRASDPASRNEALQHSANFLDARATSRRRTRQIIRSVMSVIQCHCAVVASAQARVNMSCVYAEMRAQRVVLPTRFHHDTHTPLTRCSPRIQACGNRVAV
jgi:hypothetical protein